MQRNRNTIHLVQQVLKAKEWAEDAARGDLREANTELAERESRREAATRRVEADLAIVRDAHAQGRALDLDSLQRMRAWQARGVLALDAARQAADESQVRADHALAALGAVVAERRVLQTLQDRLASTLQAEQARLACKQADEGFAARAAGTGVEA